MLTIRTLQNIKNGSKITLFSGIYAIVFGLTYLIINSIIMKLNFRKISTVWQVFVKYNPELYNLILRLAIIKGIFTIVIGIVIIYLSLFILKKKDKTAWIILFIIGIIFWAGLLTMEVLDGNTYTIIASFLGWLIFIIGMILPIRYYLEKEYPEY